MASTPPTSLPGFLRRSLLVNDDSDDDDDGEDEDEEEDDDDDEDNNDVAEEESFSSEHSNVTEEEEEEEPNKTEPPPPFSTTTVDNDDGNSEIEPVQKQLHPESSAAIVAAAAVATLEDTVLPTEAQSSTASTTNLATASTAEKTTAIVSPNSNTLQRSQTAPTPSRQSAMTNTGNSSNNNNNNNNSSDHRRASAAVPKSYKELQFEKIFAVAVVNMNDLKTLAWNGIPPRYRPHSWKIIFGYLPTNASRRQHTLQRKRAEYKDAIGQHYDIDDNSRTIQEQEVLRQVLVDVPRTAPEVQLFRNERIKKLLTRILYIWAMRHPASSYVQGINDLAMPLIVAFLTETTNPNKKDVTTTTSSSTITERVNDTTFEEDSIVDYDTVLDGSIMESVTDERLEEVEADCYWCLTNLLAGIQDHYTSDQPGVQRMVLRLEELVNRIDAELCRHLRDTGIEFMQFAFKWMNCLLLREFKLKCVIRLWDTYISENDGFEGFHVYVCAAFLCQFSNQLRSMSFDELFGFMQAMPTDDWGDTEIEMLLSQAYVLSTLFGGSDAHLTNGTTRE